MTYYIDRLGNPMFSPYVQSFQLELDKKGIPLSANSIPIMFGPTMGNAIGYCIISLNSRVITINRKYWNIASNIERELLIFHELGHCLLFLGHDDLLLSSGTSRSIMTSALTSDLVWNYRNNKKYYIDQLFHNVGKRKN